MGPGSLLCVIKGAEDLVASSGEKEIANNVNIIPCFLLSNLISQISYTSCGVRVKSQNPEQILVLGYCGRLLTSGLDLYVNIDAFLVTYPTKNTRILYSIANRSL